MADKFTVKRRSNRRRNIYRVEIFLRGRPQLSSCKIKAWKKFRPERLGFCKGSRNHPSGVNGLSHKAWWTTNIIFFAFFFSFCKYILVLEIIKWKNIRDYVFFTSTGWLEETFVFVWFFFWYNKNCQEPFSRLTFLLLALQCNPMWMRGNLRLNYKTARNCLTYMLNYNVL